MMFSRSQIRSQAIRKDAIRRKRRLVSLALLFSVCLTLVPLPVGFSGNGVEKDRSQPFPCQDRPCGCRSANQCWQKCCCFTNEQKLAWAERNGVKVPAIVLNQTIARSRTNNKETSSKNSTPLAQSCKTAGTSLRSSCCEKSAQSNCGQDDCDHDTQEKFAAEKSAASEQDKSPRVLIGVLVQKCQGEGPYWNSLPWSILPKPMEVVIPETPFTMAPLFLLNSPLDVSFRPPVPPPRTV
ncbi:MAG TPA: hypothetical protein VNQ76_00550 [Planctomicrobium sp.]|nr:hypothetical protein [Planctomicrobium sp.]